MGAPLFRQLTRDEFNRLTLEERMSYMQALMTELQKKLEETRRQIEKAKETLRKG